MEFAFLNTTYEGGDRHLVIQVIYRESFLVELGHVFPQSFLFLLSYSQQVRYRSPLLLRTDVVTDKELVELHKV